jgi:ParB family chromosome partitioning protein
MRHGRHYVDELLGEAPIRTVREIPISEIEPPPDEPLDLDRLEASIRRLGVMEPLLVTSRGLEYRVIAGMRRLRAARTVGLNTVPCLVHEVNDERLGVMRDAAIERLAPPVAPAVPAESGAPVPLHASSSSCHVDENLRSSVLNDLASVEQLREKIASAASDLLARAAPALELAPALPAALVSDAIDAVALEARLRDVRIERADVSERTLDCRISIDAARCRTALIGLLQCLLSMSSGRGAVLEVRAQMTTVRPALIINCRVVDCRVFDSRMRGGDDRPFSDETIARFFDANWREHPCGQGSATVLAAVARTARAHGGRVQLHADGTVTFVVPRPLTDL